MTNLNKPIKSKDVPVTKAMLDTATVELKSEINVNRLSIEKLDKKIDGLDQKVDNVKVELILMMKIGFEKLEGQIHRIALMMEEQNARNVFVLDKLTSLSDRQERLEKDYSERFR